MLSSKLKSPRLWFLPLLFLIPIIIILLAVFISQSRGVSDSSLAGAIPRVASCQQLATLITQREAWPLFRYDKVESPAASDGVAREDYSTTNVQVEGVDEADYVKNNGDYAYIIANDQLITVKLSDDGSTKVTNEVYFGYSQGMYLTNNQLVVFGQSKLISSSGTAAGSSSSDMALPEIAPDRGIWPSYQGTGIYIFSLSNPEEPKLVRTIELGSQLMTSRLHEDRLYLAMSHQLYSYSGRALDSDSVVDLLPSFAVKENGVTDSGKLFDCEDVYYFDDGGADSLAYVSVVDLNNNVLLDSKGMLASANQVYMSRQNLYVSSHVFEQEEQVEPPVCSLWESLMGICSTTTSTISPWPVYSQKLRLTRFELQSEGVEPVASTVLEGSLLSQFSMDEYQNHLRLALQDTKKLTASQIPESRVVVLNSKLEQVGEVTGLGRNENIYAVRFFGAKGYVVTFRQIDPLYVVDLSNPSNPSLEGELKIPGYSTYLHPINDELLFGIGRDIEFGIASTGRDLGIKFSLFNVSDGSEPIEQSTIKHETSSVWSPSSYDHRAFLYIEKQGLILVPFSESYRVSLTEIDPTAPVSGFFAIKVGGGELLSKSVLASKAIASDIYYYGYTGTPERSFYSGDVLYLLHSDGYLRSYNLATLQPLEETEIVE